MAGTIPPGAIAAGRTLRPGMTVREAMLAKLTTALTPAAIEIVDESARHAGHAGARPGGETHFRVAITAAAFAGRGRAERQRLVHGLLAEELRGGVHALSLQLRAPGE